MIAMFNELKEAQKNAIASIAFHNKEKDGHSLDIAKISKNIVLLNKMASQIYLGDVDSKCKWLWEKGSMKGFAYELSDKDCDDIFEIRQQIEQEESLRTNLARVAGDCKAKALVLESKLRYMLIKAVVKVVRVTTDNDPDSYNFGNMCHIFDIDKYEFETNGKLEFSSHCIKYQPKEKIEGERNIQWTQIRYPPNWSDKSDESKSDLRSIENSEKWSYIIETYLKPRL